MKPANFFLILFSFMFLILILHPPEAKAHEKEKHKKKAQPTVADTIRQEPKTAADTIVLKDVTPAEHAMHGANPRTVHASFASIR